MNTQGKVFKYPDNVDTDVIIPARYLNTPNAQELALHCMEDIDKAFVKKVEKGDVIVAGWNFGCGSSREHAPLVIKTCGTVASLQRALRVFSTATPSISAYRFSSARKRQTRSTQTTKFRSILIPASSPTSRPARRIRHSRSRRSFRTSSKQAAC